MADVVPTILLFENDAQMVYLLRRYAQVSGYHLIAVDTIVNILPIVQDTQPHVIVISFACFSNSAIDMLPALRSNAHVQVIPIIVLCDMLDDYGVWQHDADAWLVKPVLVSDFTDVLATVGIAFC